MFLYFSIFCVIFLFYISLNCFFFNFLKNLFYFIFFVIIFIIFAYFILKFLVYKYVLYYLLLLFGLIISFKLFSYLFFEKSPTLYLCEIIYFNQNKKKDEIKKIFLEFLFIKRYLDNLISHNLIIVSKDKLILKLKGKYLFIFFKYFYKLIF